MKIGVALSAILLIMVLPARADLFLWTDANGVKHFSNEPPPVEEGVERQPETKHSGEQYKQWEDQRQFSQSEMLKDSRESEKARDKETSTDGPASGLPGNVVMYTKPKCIYCVRARAFFKKYGVTYTEYDITADQQAYERYRKLNGNGVPLIFVGDRRIPGFHEGLLRKLLGIPD